MSSFIIQPVVPGRELKCHKCSNVLKKYKVSVKEDGMFNNYHIECAKGLPQDSFLLGGYHSLTGEEQFEVDELYKKRGEKGSSRNV